MYKIIKALPTTARLYAQQLLADGFAASQISEINQKRNDLLETSYQRLQKENVKIERESLHAQWTGYNKANSQDNPETKIAKEQLQQFGQVLTQTPTDFTPNKKIQRLLDARIKGYTDENGKIDWGLAELLAYASILKAGFHLRLSGQDCQRGTFSHRHATIHDVQTGVSWTGLESINPQKVRVEIINSLLSEMGALGFEFGYSIADPSTLVIWEAQFGDFVNNAQVIIDQFITSCEAKWHRMSGLVLLLPHGYEGQGPEHSSARLERFLQLCSQDNVQVCVPTTPAQYFHLIRRQILRKIRKPLIVMSPKSLLRLPAAASAMKDLTNAKFESVIDEISVAVKVDQVSRLILCSGRIYYDLVSERDTSKSNHVAIIRLEMLYPYPEKEITSILAKYKAAIEVIWVQDEPRNQGAWIYMETHLIDQVETPRSLHYIGRDASPSSATGYMKVHQQEQKAIIVEAFGPSSQLQNKIRIR